MQSGASTATGEVNASVGVKQWRAVLYTVAGIVCVLWLAYLFCQKGSLWDESEHAHIAWLMSQGKRPIDDFFEHHQPLLWHLLSVYYRVGFTGAGVLVWGRVIVVLCAITSVAALFHLGRTSQGTFINLAGIGGAAFLAGLTVLLPELFVSRPETLSTAFMLVSMALWAASPASQTPRVLAAGVLAGAACYASPRFLLLGGFFFLCGVNGVRRWGLLVLGGFIFVAAYTVLSGFSLENVLFNLRFSAFLQSVGDTSHSDPVPWMLLGEGLAGSMLSLVVTVDPSFRTRGVLLVGNLVAIFIGCHVMAGKFQYEQAYAPFISSIAIVATLLLARFKSFPRGAQAAVPFLGGVALLGSVNEACHWKPSPFDFPLFEELRAKNVLAALVPPGRTVLVFAPAHPIAVEDTSYYSMPLADSQNRLCLTVQGFRSSHVLPRCDFFQDIRRARPYLLDSRIQTAVRPEDIAALKQWLDENYERRPLLAGFSVETRLRFPLLVEKPNVPRAQ
jgi:hypothetical protein